MSADTKEPKKETKKEKRDDAKKQDAADDDGAGRALSAIAGALARTRDGDRSKTAGESDPDESGQPARPLVSSPSDAAAHALQAIARKHTMTSEPAISSGGASSTGTAGRQPPAGRKKTSLYDRIVEHEEDLVGLIAYALSKQRKHDWHVAFQQDMSRPPRDEEAYAFLLGEGTDKQLRAYRQQASGLLRAHAESVTSEERPEVLVAAVEERIKRSLRWSRFIPAAFVGALLVLALLGLLVWALPLLGIDIGVDLSVTSGA